MLFERLCLESEDSCKCIDAMMTGFNRIKRHSRLVFLMSVVVAFFCDIKAFNAYLTAGVNLNESGSNGPMALLYALSVICAFLLGIINEKGRMIKSLTASTIFLFVWLSLFYLFTYSFIAPPYTSVLFFGVFTLASFLMPTIVQIDSRICLKAMMFIATPTIFRINEVFRFSSEFRDVISMGLSYSFLIPVVATIVYLFIYFNKETPRQRVFTIIGVVINMIFVYKLVLYGSRGPVLSIIALLAFLLMIRPKEKEGGVKVVKGRSLTISITIIVVMTAFIPVLEFSHNKLLKMGIELNFVEKILRLESTGDISNGRSMLFDVAMRDILDNPILGLGLDQFDNQHQLLYPHNFIVQIFYDGGIVFFLVLLVPLSRGLSRLLKACSVGEFAFFTALLFGSVPGAMFSGDLWQNGMLWMLFGMLLSRNFVLKKEI